MPICAREKIFIHNSEGHAPTKTTMGYAMSMLMNTEQNQADQIMTQEDEPQNREIYMKALEYFMPACIMVSAKNEVRHLFGDCTNFIHMAPGKFTSDVFSLLTADLRIAVSTALKTAREHRRKMTYTGIPVKGEKNAQTITLTAMPIPDGFDEPSGLMAIILMDEKQSKPTDNAVAYDIDRVAAQRITDLEQELHHTQDELKHTITELESVNEELQAANEELLTANEELQSSNEELQSVNEELYTVNSEYQQKVDELGGLNNDMSNFLSTTLIGIMFIDSNLHIRKFTNYITEEFNVLPQDVGRPLQYIAYNFMNVDLIRLSQQVAATLTPLERDIVSVNGKPYFLRIAPYRAEDNKVLGLVMTFVDTTQQRTDQRQLENMEQALQRAQRANAEKNTFLSRMSHDMRTPLNAIMGYTYMTQERGDVPADVRDSLQKIQDSGEYLLGIITDVLDTSMLESGKMKSEPEPVMEEEIIHDVEDMILLQAENQRIFFIHSINGCKNECLLVDKAHVTQILVNLLSNAVKFTSENGKVEFITDVEQVDKKHIQHRYTISDNGRGMSQAFQHKMYLPFEQEMMKCDHVGGTGLGLYIVKKLIDMLGGTISCDSQPGKGTTFKVTLTYTVASPEQKQRLGQADHRDFAGLRGKKILLCDDHELNMEIAKFMLENKEMSVVCASNGQEAVEKFIQSEPGEFDAILMDIRMPVMDGLQATMKIRSDPHKDAQRIPIIALTANALEEEEQICLQAGMNARLTKPIDPPQLYQTLADYTIGKKE
jgi:two-component system CheB/CheR fusion protein